MTAGSVPDKLWEQALIGAEDVKFYIPTMATSNLDTEFYSGLGTGHLQGICVDEDMQYMYVSYTDGIGKIDLETGEVAGILTGFGSGLHIGCLAYYDGHVYGSFEANEAEKIYIIQIDVNKFSGIMDSMDEWANAIRVILLYEPMIDARDLMGDSWDDGDGIASNGEDIGHRYANAGADGITFGTYPGEFGQADADTYIYLDKVQNSKHSLLPFSIIGAASNGNVDAISAVLKHYEPYIAALDTRRLYDENGVPHLCVNDELRKTLEIELITKILAFEIVRAA